MAVLLIDWYPTPNKDDGVIDCVDIYKQPAFDHPLLRYHTIQVCIRFSEWLAIIIGVLLHFMILFAFNVVSSCGSVLSWKNLRQQSQNLWKQAREWRWNVHREQFPSGERSNESKIAIKITPFSWSFICFERRYVSRPLYMQQLKHSNFLFLWRHLPSPYFLLTLM